MKKFILILSLILSSLLLFSCGGENPTEPGGNSGGSGGKDYGTVKMSPDYVELPQDVVKSVTSVTPTKVSFSKDSHLKAGDIFILGSTEQYPLGTVRRVVSAKKSDTDGLFDVITSFSNLWDAIHSGRISFNTQIFSFEEYPSLTPISSLKISGKMKEVGRLSGYFDFSNSFKSELNFNFKGDFLLKLSANLNQNFNKTYNIYDHLFAPITISATPPVVVTARISLDAILKGLISGEVNLSTGGNIDYSFIIKYNNGWSVQSVKHSSFNSNSVEINFSSELKASLRAGLSLFLYDLIGPTVSLSPYGKVLSNINQNPVWRIYGGIDLEAGIKTRLLSSFVPDKTWVFNLFERELSSGGTGDTNKPPTALINISPSSGITTSTNVQFSDLSSIDDNTSQSNLVGRWDWEDDGNFDTGYSPLGYEYHTYLNPGTYIAKLEIKDEGGLTGTATRTISVSNSSVFNYSKFSPPNGSTTSTTDLTFKTGSFVQNPDYTLYLGSYAPSLSSIHTGVDSSYHLGNYFPVGTKVYYQWEVKGNQVDSTSPLFSFTVGNSGGGNQTVTLQPGPEGEDVTISHYTSNGNPFSSSSPDDSLLTVGNAEVSGTLRKDESFIKFNLSNIPSNSNVSSARLMFYGGVLESSSTASLAKLNGFWSEQSLTWDTKPSYTVIRSKEFEHHNYSIWYEFDVTQTVQDWVNGQTNYGFELLMPQQGNTIFLFGGDVLSDPSKRPKLEIIYQ